jgi:hypothetical protein
MCTAEQDWIGNEYTSMLKVGQLLSDLSIEHVDQWYGVHAWRSRPLGVQYAVQRKSKRQDRNTERFRDGVTVPTGITLTIVPSQDIAAKEVKEVTLVVGSG